MKVNDLFVYMTLKSKSHVVLQIPDCFSYSVLIRNMFPCDKHEGKIYHFVFLDSWVTFDTSIWFLNPTWSRIGVLGLKTKKLTCIKGIGCFLVDYNTARGDFYQGHSWSLSVKEIWPEVPRTSKIHNQHSNYILFQMSKRKKYHLKFQASTQRTL